MVRQTGIQVDIWSYIQTYKQVNTWSEIQTEVRLDRQTAGLAASENKYLI